jgi:hypothetical protein
MRGTATFPALLALLAAVVGLSACGSDDVGGQIPATNAAGLKASLSQVRDDVQAGDCDSASSGAQSFVDGVNALPAEATTELKDALRKAGERLQELLSQECPADGTAADDTQPTTSEPTTTSETTTTTSETTTTTGTETDTTTTESEPPPEEPGNGSGDGSGGPGDGSTGGGADGGTGGTGGTRG